MEVPILYFDDNGEQVFQTDVLRHIFLKIGSRPFVVLSVNGIHRTGKSFLLTKLLQQLLLIQGTLHVESDVCSPIKVKWTDDDSSDISPVGIGIWSEPITLKRKNNQEISIILMHTTGSYDPPATIQQNSTVFALSTIISSFFVFNVRKTISKDTLELMQYFLNLANSFNGLDESKRLCLPQTSQRILFLIRDMELRLKDFAHGYHTPTSKPHSTAHSQGNLFAQIFSIDPTRQPLEMQHTYRQVLSSFQQYGLFALPESSSLRATNRNRELDLEFQNYTQTLMDLLISTEIGLIYNETKQVNGVEISGNEFVAVIDQLEKIFKRSSHFQMIERTMESRAEMQNIISKSNLLSLYVSTISDFMSEQSRKTGNPGMYQKTLAEKMNSFLKICLDTFSRRLSQGDDDLKEKYREALSEEIQQKMKLFEFLNESKIKYARQTLGLKTEAETLIGELTKLNTQLSQSEASDDERLYETSHLEREMEQRLKKAHSIHLRKRIEELQGKLIKLQEQIYQNQTENENNIVQLLRIIQNISNIQTA